MSDIVRFRIEFSPTRNGSPMTLVLAQKSTAQQTAKHPPTYALLEYRGPPAHVAPPCICVGTLNAARYTHHIHTHSSSYPTYSDYCLYLTASRQYHQLRHSGFTTPQSCVHSFLSRSLSPHLRSVVARTLYPVPAILNLKRRRWLCVGPPHLSDLGLSS